ncbi:MAG: DUF2993 domain-containing protein [Oscillatoria sp. SIO1A7]|nr:DUF2993 domain-containing protein [Oscillatoria sp. SIO1A7]
MELVAIILSGLLTLISPLGVVLDSVAEKSIRSQLYSAEQLEVRVDNVPSYQYLQGKIERVRFAGRGLYLTPDFRIDTLEIETDPIDIDLERLNREGQNIPQFLRQPARGAMRLAIVEEDINQTLRSPAILEQLGQIGPNLAEGSETSERLAQRYRPINPRIEFLENNRLRFQIEIEDRRDGGTLRIRAESGLEVVSGRKLQLVEPIVMLNEKQAPTKLVNRIAKNLSDRLDLGSLDDRGLQARILQLNITPERLEIVAFARIE